MGQFQVNAPYPMPILLKAEGEAINQKHSLTNRILNLVFPSAVGLTFNEEDAKKSGLTVTELANSGKQSYTVQVSMFEQDMFNRVKTPSVLGNKLLYSGREYKDAFGDPKPLAVLVEGTFPFKYQDQPAPDWPKEEKKDDDDHANPTNPLGGMQFPGLQGGRGPRGPGADDAGGSPEGTIDLAQAEPAPPAGAAGAPAEAGAPAQPVPAPSVPPEGAVATPPAGGATPAVPGAAAENKAAAPAQPAPAPVAPVPAEGAAVPPSPAAPPAGAAPAPAEPAKAAGEKKAEEKKEIGRAHV